MAKEIIGPTTTKKRQDSEDRFQLMPIIRGYSAFTHQEVKDALGHAETLDLLTDEAAFEHLKGTFRSQLESSTLNPAQASRIWNVFFRRHPSNRHDRNDDLQAEGLAMQVLRDRVIGHGLRMRPIFDVVSDPKHFEANLRQSPVVRTIDRITQADVAPEYRGSRRINTAIAVAAVAETTQTLIEVKRRH